MKTQNDILTGIIDLLVASPINDLNGGIYKKTRPTGSDLEDCVITLIAGTNAKFLQSAGLYIKIFYNDINQVNSYFEDSKRGGELEKLLFDFSDVLLKNNEYSFQIETRETYTEKVLEEHINQHYALLKINFRTLIN